jgi:hypothetical protein
LGAIGSPGGCRWYLRSQAESIRKYKAFAWAERVPAGRKIHFIIL